MSNTYFYKQGDKPLFEDLVWSRPENRRHAGKLLIIGGNLHGFSAAALAYQEAVKAGIGTGKILLPDALRRTVGYILENGEYAPSTPSGSFSKKALATMLDSAQWADAILLAGDLGRNSETATTVEAFCAKTNLPLVETKDAVDYFYSAPQSLFNRPSTTLVVSLSQLQKLASKAKLEHAVTFAMNQQQLVDWLHDFTKEHLANIVVYHDEQIFVAVNGKVSATKVGEQKSWRVRTAAHSAVWLLQNPQKPFEALTTAVLAE